MGKISETMTALADAVRAKTGCTGKLTGEQMLEKLDAALQSKDKPFIERTIESVVIPDGVTEIKEYAFCGCHSLKSVKIPDSVTEIKEYAFSSCPSLKAITIPRSVGKISVFAFTDSGVHFRFRCARGLEPDGYPWNAHPVSIEFEYTGDE